MPKEFKIKRGVLIDYRGSGGAVEIPDGVKRIGAKAFYECNRVTSVTVPDSVESIGKEAFYCRDGLTNVKLGNGVKSIEDGAFSGCESLSNINLPEGLTRINDGVFECCRSLANIKVPDSVVSIGIGAFNGCWALRNIEGGNNVVSVEMHAFYQCQSGELKTEGGLRSCLARNPSLVFGEGYISEIGPADIRNSSEGNVAHDSADAAIAEARLKAAVYAARAKELSELKAISDSLDALDKKKGPSDDSLDFD